MSFPNKTEQFLKSIENFLIICENSSFDFDRQREKLNNILNDLNSFDFKLVQLIEVGKVCVGRISFEQEIFKHFPFNRSLKILSK